MQGQGAATAVEPVDQESIGANAYNTGMRWAFRCTWDRSAFDRPFPAHSYGRAMTREEVARIAEHMMRHQNTASLPLIEVAAMGPGESAWTVVARRPSPAIEEP